jgi:mannosyl-oligosaccharide glucosidase
VPSTLNPPVLAASSLTPALSAASNAFVTRFHETFDLASKGYSPRQVAFAREITASIVGGIGYFHGDSLVDSSFAHDYDGTEGSGQGDPEPKTTEKKELFTSTPSRPFFPRGFYWCLMMFFSMVWFWVLIMEFLTGTKDFTCSSSANGTMTLGLCFSKEIWIVFNNPWRNSLEILKSWINLIDENGWVAREQILGDEARSKVRLGLLLQ